MKRIALALLVLLGCSKSDAPKADPAPSPVERGAPDPSDHPRAGRRDEAALDTDGDGKVTGDERAAGRHKRIEAMRAKLDANGDGKLTPDELAKDDGRMKFDDPAAVDTNHDGDISLDELETAMKARRDQMKAKWRHDRDGGSAAAP